VLHTLTRRILPVGFPLVRLLEDGGGLRHRVVAPGLFFFREQRFGSRVDAFLIVGHQSSLSDSRGCQTPGRRVPRRSLHPRSKEVAMPARGWSDKRERQYEHIKEGLRERGESEDTAEEIAARTVNKERARAGEARTASRSSVDDISSGRRGGLRSHSGPGGRTKEQLYNEAKHKGVKGRSKMTKRELEKAVGR